MAKTSHPLDEARTAEMRVIGKIADRAVNLYAQNDIRVDRTDVLLDVMTVHNRVQKLRLDDLLTADDVNFAHDIGGINRHLDRDNYALMDGFRPRYCEARAA
jgi:hypothetical protein